MEKQPVENNEEKIQFEKNVASAKVKIIGCIGEEKYEILRRVCEKLAASGGWDEFRDLEVDAVKLIGKICSIELVSMAENSRTELSKELEISNFLAQRGASINGFNRSKIFSIVNAPLKCVANGISGIYAKTSQVFDEKWGSGVRFETYEGKVYYEVFVSNNYENIKFHYYENMDFKRDCTIILKV